MNKPKKVGLYIRISTLHQNTDLQLTSLKDYCSRRGWGIKNIYRDIGESGKKESRPAFDRLLKDAARGDIKTIVVFRCDRFSRSVRHFINTLHTLEKNGVGFVSVNEGIDLTSNNPLNKVVMLLVSALAEMELNILKSRQKAGITAAKDKGVKFGRPRLGFDVKKALELRGSGLSLRKISKSLGISVSTLCRNLPKPSNIAVS